MKTRSKLFTVTIILIFLTTLLWAEKDDSAITLGETATINSEILDQDRELLIYLPDGYEKSTTNYPVLYLIDGGFHFLHVSSVVQYLSSRGMMQQTIVVAIKNIDRNKDFLPTNVERVPTSGGAENFLNFISNELFTYIESNYRTTPYKTLVGHSYGGTFTTYTFLQKPNTFDSYIAISPYLHWDEQLLVTQAETILPAGYDKNKFFYMTLGDEPPYIPAIDKFVSLINDKSPTNLDFTYTQMISETHNSIPHLTVYYGLEKLYSGWNLPQTKYEEGLSAIDEHYNMISNKFNYNVETPEFVINMLGYNYLLKEEFEKAIEVFQENV
ncbi:MAG: alpha/beta hydrolase, partial [Candidatus Cloacimonetes bacterium]|nr:alpha/beta hydrolase [Candidatus Cloacimonadota bacterium]